MTSSILDIVLLAALAGTSGAVLLMYRRLKRFDALQSTAAVAFSDAATALDRAREAMRTLHDEGGDMALTLAARLNEARMVMNDIDDRSIKALRIELVPPASAASPSPATTAPGSVGAEVPVGTSPAPTVALAAPGSADEEVRTATVPPPRSLGTVAGDRAPAPAAVAATSEVPLVSAASPASAVAPATQDAARASSAARASAAMRAAASRATGPRAATAGLAASPAMAAAIPQPAPSPLPPRVGSPTPLRTPTPRLPQVEEPTPTLHRTRTPVPAPIAAKPKPVPVPAPHTAEPTFGSRAITLADLARAARAGAATGGFVGAAAARGVDLAHA